MYYYNKIHYYYICEFFLDVLRTNVKYKTVPDKDNDNDIRTWLAHAINLQTDGGTLFMISTENILNIDYNMFCNK